MTGKSEPAFPENVVVYNNNMSVSQTINGGLTKREYFAGLAMLGILSSKDLLKDVNRLAEVGDQPEILGRMALNLADALIEELIK